MADPDAAVGRAAAHASIDASPPAPDPNIHSPLDFERDYSGRDWRFYRGLVAVCVEYGEPGPILDVGAGLGFFVEACERYGIRCTGIEGSEYAVRVAQARHPIDIRHHYLSHRWPFSDTTFSAVVCYQTLEHLTPPIAETVLRECFRVLRPGGLLAIYSPCLYDPDQAAEPTHINLYTPTRLRGAVGAAGFLGYRALDSSRPLLGRSRAMKLLLNVVFRALPLDWLSTSANCIAYKPLVGPAP